MKKIIYSLVIMIAAGSLFTSCIQPNEPEGILDLRKAKAEYIRSLTQVSAADAELTKAKAAVEQANARYRDAETAWQNERTNYQKLLNEQQELLNEALAMDNEKKAAEIAKEIERIENDRAEAKLKHEAEAARLQQALLEALEDLRVAQRNIELASQDLTQEEKEALVAAAGAYYVTIEALAEQTINVFKAQQLVDSLKDVKANGTMDQVWDPSSMKYVSAIKYWEDQIAAAKKQIEEDEAKIASVPSPDIEDINKWNEEIKSYEDAIAALEYANAEIEMAKANYYVKYVHDGVAAYNDEITVWASEHPAVAEPSKAESDLAKKEPKQADYKKGGAAEIKFPTLEVKEGAAYAKFEYLLTSYNQASPANAEKKMISKNDKGELVIVANQAMKAFILGDENGAEKSQKVTINKKEYTADYGLYGALATLKRDKVLGETLNDPSANIAKKKAAMEAAEKAWKADYDTLINGLTKYAPYSKAIAAYEEAVKNAGTADGMINALNALMSEFAKIEGKADISYNDSLAIFNALVKFAAERENYLEYTYDSKKDAHNKNYFRYSTGKTTNQSGTVVNVDSVKFSALNWTNFRAHRYDYDPDDFVKYSVEEAGFANILNQLLNEKYAEAIKANPVEGLNITNINEGNYNAFYGLYAYDSSKKQITTKDGEVYISKAVTDAQKAVKDAVAAYIKVYNRFWAQNVSYNGSEYETYFTTTKAADKAKALTAAETAVNKVLPYKILYSYDTFTDPYNVVTFLGEIESPVYTNAMGAILGSVDPLAEETKGEKFNDNGFVSGSAVFGENNTEFYKYMRSIYEYNLAAKETVSDDFDEIESWIKAVEKAFVDDAAAANEDDTKAFEAAKKDYDAAVKKVNAYNDYQKELAKFVGTHKDAAGKDVLNFTDVEKAKIVEADLAGKMSEKDVLGNYTGAWDTDVIGGQLLENANKYFPELPANLKAWKEEKAQNDEEILHKQILKKAAEAAYLAAAKAAGYEGAKDASNWAELLKAYNDARNAYVEGLQKEIAKLKGDIQDLTKNIADFKSGVPAIDLQIAMAEKDLQIAQIRYAAIQKAHDYAKANYEKIFGYIKGIEDFNFVDFSNMQLPEGTIDMILAYLGLA